VAVCSVEYRLAPEHPFPAALDDAIAVYQGLLNQGFSAHKIVIGGDSAGGGLTLATLLHLRDEGIAPYPLVHV
jgi:acetyl esterase/lipase